MTGLDESKYKFLWEYYSGRLELLDYREELAEDGVYGNDLFVAKYSTGISGTATYVCDCGELVVDVPYFQRSIVAPRDFVESDPRTRAFRFEGIFRVLLV